MDTTYNEIKKRILMRNEAADVISNLGCFGFWVKDMHFRFLEISEKTSDILYSCSSDKCIGKTDFEIAKELGLTSTDEQQFAEVCRASDKYVLNNSKDGQYQIFRFIELINDTNGNKHIWETVKGIVPKEVGKGKYYFGYANFLDEIMGGYDNAFKWVEDHKKHLTILNPSLYKYE